MRCVGLSFLKVNGKCLGPKQYFSLRVMCFLVSTLSDSHPGLWGGEKRLPIWHILPKASPETRIHVTHLTECWFPQICQGSGYNPLFKNIIPLSYKWSCILYKIMRGNGKIKTETNLHIKLDRIGLLSRLEFF